MAKDFVGIGRNIDIDIDSEQVIQLKCDPMFRAELEEAIREMARVARVIVTKDHESAKKIIANRGKAVGPRRGTGNMRKSIQPYAGRSARGQVHRVGPATLVGTISAGSRRAPYTEFVHEGTFPHMIRARPGGVLSFYGSNPGTYTISRRSLIPEALLTPAGQKARARRIKLGGRSRMRLNDPDTFTGDQTFTRASRAVVVTEVDHPGYRGNKFLNKAVGIVMAKRYGKALPARLL
jgi:hypothetical protein